MLPAPGIRDAIGPTGRGDGRPFGGRLQLAAWVAIGGAWLLASAAQVTGRAGLLHHHTLIEGGPPLWVALPLFLAGWQVMVVAMMLPASLPSIARFAANASRRAAPGRALAGFLAADALVWTAFGVVAFLGDVVLHRVVDSTPWLDAHPWLIEASVVVVAGVYQLTPSKARSLVACRDRGRFPMRAMEGQGAHRAGLVHGLDCLVSTWALMLLMFAEGFANVFWMAALTGVMVYEGRGRYGRRASRVVGLFLLARAMMILWSGGGE